MRAAVYERNGGPEVLEVREVPDPEPKAGEVLVRVEAIGINYRDVYERQGVAYSTGLPSICGVEGAGTIEETGERVGWCTVDHSYAEKVAASRDALVPLPEAISSEIAAAALLQGMTAHYMTFDSYPVEVDDWVLVHAGAGGVGRLAIQLAKLRGGRVAATTGNKEKAELARQAGADIVIGYEGFSERVREITNGEGVAAVYDGVGKATFAEGLTALRPTGKMILIGAASGQPEPFDLSTLSALGSLYVQRPTLRTYIRTKELLDERAGALFQLIEEQKLHITVGGRYRLDEAARAHEDLEGRRTTGKLLLVP